MNASLRFGGVPRFVASPENVSAGSPIDKRTEQVDTCAVRPIHILAIPKLKETASRVEMYFRRDSRISSYHGGAHGEVTKLRVTCFDIRAIRDR